METPWKIERKQTVEAANELARMGLVAGTSGNVSQRLSQAEGRELLAITPSQKPYSSLTPEDIVVVDFEGEPVEGQLVPSSETMIHVQIYKARQDVRAVIHAHPIFCSVAAVAGMDIPPIIDELVILVGGAIKVSEYAFPGTEDLARSACSALGERKAVLLRNHGMVGVGESLQEALDICLLVERAAQIFIHASQLGKVNLLPAVVIEAEESLYRMRLRAEQE